MAKVFNNYNFVRRAEGWYIPGKYKKLADGTPTLKTGPLQHLKNALHATYVAPSYRRYDGDTRDMLRWLGRYWVYLQEDLEGEVNGVQQKQG